MKGLDNFIFIKKYICFFLIIVVLATSGIDHNIKIWAPLAETPAQLDDKEQVCLMS